MPSPPPADEFAQPDPPKRSGWSMGQRSEADRDESTELGTELGTDEVLDLPEIESSELVDSELEDSELDVLDNDGAVIEWEESVPFDGSATDEVAFPAASISPSQLDEPRGIENKRARSGPLLVEASGLEAVTPQTFARLGVHESETRVVTIRNASRRAANQILAAHRSGALPDLVDPLADLAWTTYRLVDPRYRLVPFQQVRVGRILPLLLHQAAIDDLPVASGREAVDENAHALDPKPTPPPFLFGRCLPVVSYPITMDSATSDLNLEATSKAAQLIESSDPASLPSVNIIAATRHQSESMQAYAELRQARSTNLYRRAFERNRVLVGLVVVAFAAATLLVAFAIRRSITPTTVVAQTTKHQAQLVDRTLSEPIAPGNVHSEPELPPEPIPTDAGLVESVASVSETETVMPETKAIPELAEEESPEAIEPVTPAELVSPAEPVKPAEPVASAESNSDGETSLMETDLNESPADAVSMKVDPSIVASNGESIEAAMEASVDDSPIAVEPTPIVDTITDTIAKTIPWDSEDTQLVAAEIWERTPSAARRFTLASAAELIDQWDFDAELSSYGTVEHAAARSLALRAAWLVEPFAQLVDRIREPGPIRDFAEGESSDDSTPQNDNPTYHLQADELELLVRSWEAARSRVVIADDLDQLLHQANVLVDRILVSDQVSPFERADLVSAMTLGTERLTRIARDEIAVAESNQLAEALEAFPEASELERLESSDQPSGFLGRVRCLKQRQWNVGLEWLTHTSDRVIASCAKAEWELLNSDTATPEQWIDLAERWTKVAVRLPDREAAAVNLHALELYGQSDDYASQRAEIIATLPRYMVR